MSARQDIPDSVSVSHGHDDRKRIENFQDPRLEWRRLFSELLGTFFLVLVAAGAGMMNAAFPGTIGRSAEVVAPGLMVMAIILFMGKVSGAHLNPAVTVAFALRGDFPWRRVPGYIVVQLVGATLAALSLHAVLNVSSVHGSNYPASGYSSAAAMWVEMILTVGLVSVILGTASGAERWPSGRLRRRRLYRPGGTVGQPAVGGLDEPGTNIRSRLGGHQIHRFLGLRGRPDWRCHPRRRLRHRVTRSRR